MEGRTSAVQYKKVDVAILFHAAFPTPSVLHESIHDLCVVHGIWKYTLFEIRNFSLAVRFRMYVRDENVGGESRASLE